MMMMMKMIEMMGINRVETRPYKTNKLILFFFYIMIFFFFYIMIFSPCMAAISGGIDESRGLPPTMRYLSLVSAAIWMGREVRALPLTSSDSRLRRSPIQ